MALEEVLSYNYTSEDTLNKSGQIEFVANAHTEFLPGHSRKASSFHVSSCPFVQ